MALNAVMEWAGGAWRAVLAEFLATGLLVFLGLAATVPAPADPPLLYPALTFGCVVACLAAAFGPASGAHLNPCITVAAVIRRKTPLLTGVVYVAAQSSGGVAGFALLKVCAPQLEAPTGMTLPSVGPAAAVAVEAVLSAALALLVCALWERPHPAAPLMVGSAVTGLIVSGGSLTGASMNPARSLGPAAVYGCWDRHWVYWVGPPLGAALAALLSPALLPPPPPDQPAPPAEYQEVPLQDMTVKQV